MIGKVEAGFAMRLIFNLLLVPLLEHKFLNSNALVHSFHVHTAWTLVNLRAWNNTLGGVLPLGASKNKKNRKTYGRNTNASDEEDVEEVDTAISEESLDILALDFKKSLEAAKEKLEADLMKISATRATPGLVDTIEIELDSKTTRQLRHLAHVVTLDNNVLKVEPIQKEHLTPIFCTLTMELANYKVQLENGFILVNIPSQGAKARLQALEIVKNIQNNSKASIRVLRQDAMNKLRKKKGGLSEDMLFRQEVCKGRDVELQKRIEEIFKRVAAALDAACTAKIKSLAP
ncbi:bifunctional RRF superfamily/Ribosome recycling factor domain/Ribosome recycling factor [Babesia duncani]|uniref:Bifunctional RRF superfamily/Ribosome recycling factor domain/Ribosome recycling factor n=1 Tax=Babesia duncani TaxID=323732 RepID=A0AAD9PNZ9_9APIC|nr:bifunctional RRF superfamily/Ribosome recycling factor domain/Ribosome recycling factor [Babesia duncani]